MLYIKAYKHRRGQSICLWNCIFCSTKISLLGVSQMSDKHVKLGGKNMKYIIHETETKRVEG